MTTPNQHASWSFLSPARAMAGFSSEFLCLALVWACYMAVVMPVAAAPRDRPGEKPFGLIYGTVWGPDERPLYGVKIEIRRADQKKAHWEVYSDHRGEFAQRVPPGPGDYVVWPDLKGFKYPHGGSLRLEGEVKVHVDNDEREDIGLHLKK